MKKMIVISLSIAIAALCFRATPAMADFKGMVSLDDFSYGTLVGTYAAGHFTVTLAATGSGSATSGDSSHWADGLKVFSLDMTVDSGGAGAGTITLTDIGGDTITGAVQGTWVKVGKKLFLDGSSTTLSDVVFHNQSGDGYFNGATDKILIPDNHLTGSGYVSVTSLSLVKGTESFGNESWTTLLKSGGTIGTGSLDGSVCAVPLPAAVLLGFLALGTTGLGLRKLS